MAVVKKAFMKQKKTSGLFFSFSVPSFGEVKLATEEYLQMKLVLRLKQVFFFL